MQLGLSLGLTRARSVISGEAPPEETIADTDAALWWDIQDLTTLWTTTGRTLNSSVGSAVAYIDDKIGSYDFSLASGTITLRQDGTSGKYYLEVATNTHGTIANGTSFCTDRPAAAGFAAVDSDDNTGDALVFQFQRTTNNSSLFAFNFADGVPRATARRSHAEASNVENVWAGGAVTGRCVVAAVADMAGANTLTVRVNGVDNTPASALVGSGNFANTNGNGGQAFNITTLAQDFQGNLFGFVAFRSLPSAGDVTIVEDHLNELIA